MDKLLLLASLAVGIGDPPAASSGQPHFLVFPITTQSGDEIVRVYPVRTALSRFLTQNADCVVDILPPFGKETQLLDLKLRNSLQNYLPRVEVKEKGRIMFRVSTDRDARNALDRFVNTGSHRELAQSVGYKEATVRDTPR